MTRSNCRLWAWQERRRLRAAGYGGPGREIYRVRRESRSEGVPFEHELVGLLDPATGQIAVRSFKPIEPRAHAWWEVLLLAAFEGHVVEGDAHVPVAQPPVPAWKRAVGALLIAGVAVLPAALVWREAAAPWWR